MNGGLQPAIPASDPSILRFLPFRFSRVRGYFFMIKSLNVYKISHGTRSLISGTLDFLFRATMSLLAPSPATTINFGRSYWRRCYSLEA